MNNASIVYDTEQTHNGPPHIILSVFMYKYRFFVSLSLEYLWYTLPPFDTSDTGHDKNTKKPH